MAKSDGKYVIFRDDDISFFTRPQWIEELYAPLFEKGKSVSLSVIPEVNAGVKIENLDDPYLRNASLKYQPFIPPQFRGASERFRVDEDSELLHFIKQNANQIEIVQHGFSHEFVSGRKEFKIEDDKLISARIKKGKDILKNAFGAEPKFFVPPWDSVSPAAMKALKENFSGISLAAYPHHLLPRTMWLKFLYKKKTRSAYLWWNSFLIVNHRRTFLSKFKSPEQIWREMKELYENFDIIVVVNHHWEFYYDWDSLDKEYFNIWQKVLNFFLMQENVEIVSFDSLYNSLR